MTICRQFAEYALNLTYDDLPEEVIYQTKRVLLDAVGCAFGGYDSKTVDILRGWIREQKEPTEATILGGPKTSCLYATLINGAMVRYLDYNDAYLSPSPVFSGGHPSDVIPSILAVAERQHVTGKQLMTAIVAGYELSARFTDGCTIGTPLEQRGWNIDLRAGFIVPPVIGKLLCLNVDQIENAIGIAGCRTMLLGIVDAPKEEYTMVKNLRFPWGAHDGIVATYLAQRGFTGPKTVIEGHRGFMESVMHGEFDVKKCTDFTGFRIMQTDFKPFVADRTTHGHLTATLYLVKEHNIKPEDVAKIEVWATTRDVEHTGMPAKRYPTNKETADHSSYYLTAIAIVEQKIGPNQFSAEKFTDPMVRNLNDKMIFNVAPELDEFTAAGITEITTKQGAKFRHQVNYPKGDPRNPMSDKELEEKFRNMASRYISEKQIKTVMKTIYEMEKLDDIGKLMKLLVFSS